MRSQVARPLRLPVVEQSDVGAHAAAGHLAEPPQGVAECADLAEPRRVRPGVRHERRVELLRPGQRGAPLEEPDGVGAAGHVPQRVEQQLTRPLRAVHRLPVHRARGRLHQQPRRPARHPAGEVGAERLLGVWVREARVEVVVLGDQVQVGGPAEVVLLGLVGGDHQVRRDRHVRGELAQQVPLRPVVAQQLVGGEAGEVQLVGRVGDRGGEPRREHLVEAPVALRPERGAPRLVQRLDRAVASGEPAPERRSADVAPALADVAAQLVAHMPQPDRRVAPVAARQLLDQAQRVFPEQRRAGAPGLPAARPQRPARRVDGQHLRVCGGQPRRRGRGGRRHVDRDAPFVQEAEHLVEPVEVVPPGLRLQQRPREHPERHEPDARLAHERDVLPPHRRRPLLGVVVAAHGDAVERDRSHVAPSDTKQQVRTETQAEDGRVTGVCQACVRAGTPATQLPGLGQDRAGQVTTSREKTC